MIFVFCNNIHFLREKGQTVHVSKANDKEGNRQIDQKIIIHIYKKTISQIDKKTISQIGKIQSVK